MWAFLLISLASAAEPTASAADYDVFVLAEGVYRFAHDGLDIEPDLTPALSGRWQVHPSWMVGLGLELTLPEDGGSSSFGHQSKSKESWVRAWPVRPELLAEWAPLGDVSSGLHLGAGMSACGATYWESKGSLDTGLPNYAYYEEPVGTAILTGRLSAGGRLVLHPGIALGLDVGARLRGFVPRISPVADVDGDKPGLTPVEPVAMMSAGWAHSPGAPPPPVRFSRPVVHGLLIGAGVAILSGAAFAVVAREVRVCGGLGGCRVD